MSEEAKELLKRLKKAKKIDKQLELVQALAAHNQEEIVNHVLLIHLQRKDHISLRLEILNSLNSNFDEIIQPLISIINSPDEPLPVKEKAIVLLGENGSKKAMKELLKSYKRTKDPTIKDNIAYALTFFNDSSIIKPLIKALHTEELQLQVLSGLARNEHVILNSKKLMKELINLNLQDRFKKLHFEKILDSIFNAYNLSSIEELETAINTNAIDKEIQKHQKEQQEIDQLLKKVK